MYYIIDIMNLHMAGNYDDNDQSLLIKKRPYSILYLILNSARLDFLVCLLLFLFQIGNLIDIMNIIKCLMAPINQSWAPLKVSLLSVVKG